MTTLYARTILDLARPVHPGEIRRLPQENRVREGVSRQTGSVTRAKSAAITQRRLWYCCLKLASSHISSVRGHRKSCRTGSPDRKASYAERSRPGWMKPISAATGSSSSWRTTERPGPLNPRSNRAPGSVLPRRFLTLSGTTPRAACRASRLASDLRFTSCCGIAHTYSATERSLHGSQYTVPSPALRRSSPPALQVADRFWIRSHRLNRADASRAVRWPALASIDSVPTRDAKSDLIQGGSVGPGLKPLRLPKAGSPRPRSGRITLVRRD
jgi:hypothetical protein